MLAVELSSFFSLSSCRHLSANVRPMVISVFSVARRCWIVCLSVDMFVCLKRVGNISMVLYAMLVMLQSMVEEHQSRLMHHSI